VVLKESVMIMIIWGGFKMTELKTLNDIELVHNQKGCKLDGKLYVESKILKKEVIKWYHRSDGNKHKFIKTFFNIKESDLK